MQEQNLAIAEIIYKYRKHETLTDEEIAVLSSWLSESAEREAWFDALQGDEGLQVEPQTNITAGGKWELWNKYNQRYQVRKELRIGLKLMVSAVVVVVAMFCFVPTYIMCGLETPVSQCTVDVVPEMDEAILKTADVCRFAFDNKGGGTAKWLNGSFIWHINYKNEAPNATTHNMIITPRGGKYQIALPDGSKVWLNAGSSLTYPAVFNGTERRVQLNGEGYFEVMNMEEIPFVVSVVEPGKPCGRTTEVRVLGAHFNINAYGEEKYIKTTPLEGKVKVAFRRLGNRTVVLPQELQGEVPALPVTALAKAGP